jgi:hypothetical protein
VQKTDDVTWSVLSSTDVLGLGGLPRRGTFNDENGDNKPIKLVIGDKEAPKRRTILYGN